MCSFGACALSCLPDGWNSQLLLPGLRVLPCVNEDIESVVSLTKQQIAPRLNVSLRTVENMMANRDIPYWKRGKVVRFYWPDVLDALRRKYGVGYQPGVRIRSKL